MPSKMEEEFAASERALEQGAPLPSTKEKTVTIGIKVDRQFVNLLHSQVILSGMKDKDELTPGDQLALIAYLEMRGALEEEIHAATLHAWRNNITIVPELRKVEFGVI